MKSQYISSLLSSIFPFIFHYPFSPPSSTSIIFPSWSMIISYSPFLPSFILLILLIYPFLFRIIFLSFSFPSCPLPPHHRPHLPYSFSSLSTSASLLLLHYLSPTLSILLFSFLVTLSTPRTSLHPYSFSSSPSPLLRLLLQRPEPHNYALRVRKGPSLLNAQDPIIHAYCGLAGCDKVPFDMLRYFETLVTRVWRNKLFQVLTLLACIRVLPGSTLGRDTDCWQEVFVLFLNPYRRKRGYYLVNRSRPLPYISFPINRSWISLPFHAI
jgi:hypothetical protein